MSYLDSLRGRIERTNRGEQGDYVCDGCGAGFDRRRQVCPECGGYSIGRREWRSLR